jgi:hypothetical protein
MLVAVGMLMFLVGLCRLYKSDREHAWLVAVLAVAFGLLLLAVLDFSEVAEALAGHLAGLARTAAERAAPFLLVGALFALLWRLAHLCWRCYPRYTPGRRGIVLLITVSLGVAVAAALRVAPYLPDVVRVAGEGARAGWEAGWRRLWTRLAIART